MLELYAVSLLLTRGVDIVRINQVWSADITYIRMEKGFVYLTAIIDWFSRYVLDWEISVTMDPEFCCATLARALRKALPEIFNTDQGSQYTSKDHTGLLLQKGVLVSMDGKGRALDNVFVERLWRSVKQEEVYLVRLQDCPGDQRKALGLFPLVQRGKTSSILGL